MRTPRQSVSAGEADVIGTSGRRQLLIKAGNGHSKGLQSTSQFEAFLIIHWHPRNIKVHVLALSTGVATNAKCDKWPPQLELWSGPSGNHNASQARRK